jgi:hypothetical protein
MLKSLHSTGRSARHSFLDRAIIVLRSSRAVADGKEPVGQTDAARSQDSSADC